MNRDESIDYAKKYLEDLLSFFGLNTEVKARCEDDEVIELIIPSTHLNGFLIGQRGETLRSLQFLLSTSLRNAEAALYRVNIDVANYKKHRAERMADQARKWCEELMERGGDMALKPMNAVDRRTVHKVVGDFPQIESHSEGEGMNRHIILSKVADESED